MASIYKGAVSSLVLDAELMATKLELTETKEMTVVSRARIACSAWMTRSWTLQEGQLPPNIAVRFLDNTAVLAEVHSTWQIVDNQERVMIDSPLPSNGQSSRSESPGISSNQEVEGMMLGDRLLIQGETQDQHAQHACEIIGERLQATLCSTFSQSTSTSEVTLASVWDNLSGRSTTKPNDVPLTITNTLHLDNRRLLNCHDAGEMFEHILLSLKHIPLSIFFNTGPKMDQDGNHQNRWVPEKIGTDMLSAPEVTAQRDSKGFWDYRHEASHCVSIYTINAILPLKSKVLLRLGNDATIFAIASPVSDADRFDTEGFTSTCIIVADFDQNYPDVMQGAYFFARSPHDRDLTFYCPIRLQQEDVRDPQNPDTEKIYVLTRLRPPRHLKIKCDIPAGFETLKKRKKFNSFPIFSYTVFLLLVVPAVYISLLVLLVRTMISESLAALCMIVSFVLIITVLSLESWVMKWDTWMYVRSFEGIAKERARRRGV